MALGWIPAYRQISIHRQPKVSKIDSQKYRIVAAVEQ
jgi:hypothetical protein